MNSQFIAAREMIRAAARYHDFVFVTELDSTCYQI